MNQGDMSRRLRSWMVDAGWTLEETAERLGVSAGSLKGWVYGQRRLPLDRACQICDVFGKSLDELACREREAV